ncbi:hypothetical protein Tco_1569054 [Tanacetum coccineum]
MVTLLFPILEERPKFRAYVLSLMKRAGFEMKGEVALETFGKLNPRYVGSFKMLEQVESIAYKLGLPQELSRVHNTFHVSNLRKYYADEPLAVPLDELHFDDKLRFVEKPVEIMDRRRSTDEQGHVPYVMVPAGSVMVPAGSVMVPAGSVMVTTGSVIVTLVSL